MIAVNSCATCGAVVSSDAPEGMCPKCLLKRALDSGLDIQPKPPGKGTHAYRGPFIPPTPEELAPLFPQLEILELLGQGGMGAVYKARQANLDRMVALKILPPEASRDPAFCERFQREARALARLSHPNIVAVYDYGQAIPPDGHALQSVGAEGLCYFVMEYVDGVNLRQVIRAGTLKPEEALRIVPQVCDALHYAHEEGIVHRDIKPENILLDRKGRVKIADYGLAKLLGTPDAVFTLTSPQQVMGTIHYMAPEQMEKPHGVDHRADIYSLGVVFYEMLTGELPLGRFPLPSHKVQIDVRLDDVVLRTLEKHPERRYQRASEVKLAVEQIAAAAPSPRRAVPVAVSPDAAAPAARARSAQEEYELEMSRMAVKGPVAGLYLVAILYMLGGVVGFVSGMVIASFSRGSGDQVLAALLGVGALIVGPLLGGIVLYGARQMARLQGYEWAIFASILAMLTLPWLVGVIGIWSLVVLRRSDVRTAFVRRAMGGLYSAPILPMSSGVLPVTMETYAGFWTAKGLVRLADDALLLEAEVGVLSSKVRQCRIAFKDMASILLQRGWTSDSVVITTSSLSALSDVPGAGGGELKMKVAREHRPLAERLVATVLQRMSPMHANVAPVAAFAVAPASPAVPPTSPYVEAPRERGPVGRVFHSFAKAAKNLFMETTFETQPPAAAQSVAQSVAQPAPRPMPPVAQPVLDDDEQVRQEMVHMQVRSPAIAMMIVAFLHLGFWCAMSIIGFISCLHWPNDLQDVWVPVIWSLMVPVFLVVFLMVVGARSMIRLERYGLATFASYFIRVPWSPFFVFGLPFGFWARGVLKRFEVRQGFARQAVLKARGAAPRRSRWTWLLTYAMPASVVAAYAIVCTASAFNMDRGQPHRYSNPFFIARYQQLLNAARSGDYRGMRSALQLGFVQNYINEIDNNTGRAVIHEAVQSGNVSVVELLLSEGADPSLREKFHTGETPLLMALSKNNLDIVRILIERNANVNGTNFAGFTPLMRAAEQGHAAVVAELLGRNARTSARTKDGATALHLAAGAGHTEIVRLLLDSGADVKGVTDNRESVLQLAARHGQIDCVNLLLEKGAKDQVNQKTRYGETPLASAIGKERKELEKLLRDAGAADTAIVLVQKGYGLALKSKHAEAIPLLHEAISKHELKPDEPSWRFVVGSSSYETAYPYLFIHLVLSECYNRTEKRDERFKQLEECLRVWPSLPNQPQELPIYERTQKQVNKELIDRFSVTHAAIKGQIDNRNKLPVKQWLTYDQWEIVNNYRNARGRSYQEQLIY